MMTPDTTSQLDGGAPEALDFKGVALITASQLAKLLGISERTVYRLKSSNRLPESIILGGSVRWRLDDVRRWIDAGCQTPSAGR